MSVYSGSIKLKTSGEVDMIDITSEVAGHIRKSKMKDGIVCVFVPGATGAVTTIEYEDGLLKDFPIALERLMPKNMQYHHELRWHDGNGHSHVRASFLGPSLSVPFSGGQLILGTWQQIVFVELDTHSRRRDLIVQIVGG
ncbi:MAG: YjbQ family protein [Thermoplasmata archaeon]|nr:MAG: YjbQ family protein [Thermoplasmata archaeon]